MRQLYSFKIGTEDDSVDKIFEMEDTRVKLSNAGMSVDSDTLYACSVSARDSGPESQSGLRS